jgi:predicted DCC family thiol-disulfide oxidoreductase YuxK
MSAGSNPVLLYDGVCAFCNRAVQFILNRDRRDTFRFATLQSDFARPLLEKRGSPDLGTIYLVLDFGQSSERVLDRSTATIAVLRELGPFWRLLANLLTILPRALRDWGYNLISRHRYRLFGKFETCPLPQPKDRGKFLDFK